MCAKKRHRSSSDFLHYLKEDLSNQERHDLERGLESDPFEKEAMEGLESIPSEKAENDLLSLHVSMRKRLGRRKRVAWYSIAATAASILIVGSIFLNIYDLNPEKNAREALTEESFRTLDPESDNAGTAEETLPEIKSEEPVEELRTERRDQAESHESKQAIAEAAPAPAAPAVVAPVEEQELSEPEVEPVKEIVAEEAMPRERKKFANKRSKSVPSEDQVNQAMSGKISGIVVSSEDMDPLPGASIVIRGSNSGTVADMDGRFSLPSDDTQTTVVASYIGMETEEYQLDNESENQLVMQPNEASLDEIVVVAQGSERVYGISSVSTPSIEQEKNSPIHIPAEPTNGYKAFKKYIEQNMVFPESHIPGAREVLILKFTVQSTGTISDIQALRTPGESYTREAIRLIREGPEWIPASRENVIIDEQVRIRIVFKK